jgi:hypothetical protein
LFEETTMSTTEDRSRRDFLRQAGAVGAAIGVAGSALGAAKSSGGKTSARVLGANDRINVGVIGVGGRGHYVGGEFAKHGKSKANCQVLAGGGPLPEARQSREEGYRLRRRLQRLPRDHQPQ